MSEGFKLTKANDSLPTWLAILAWASLLGLALLPCMPNTKASINIAFGAGALALMLLIKRDRSFLPSRRFLAIVGLAMAAGVFSCIYPACLNYPDLKTMADCFHDYSHLLKGVVVAGLALALLRKPEEFATLLWLLALAGLLLALFTPLLHVLQSLSPMSDAMYGPDHYPTEHAELLYRLGFVSWMLLLSPALRQAKPVSEIAGYICLIVCVVSMLIGWKPFGGFDFGPAPAINKTLLAVVTCSIGAVLCLVWRFICKGGLCGKIGKVGWVILSLSLALYVCNIIFTVRRAELLLFFIAALLAVIIVYGWKRSRIILGPLFLAAVVAVAVLAHNPRAFNSISVKHRHYIWAGALEAAKDLWPWGAGYGNFPKAWAAHKPELAAFGLEGNKEIDPKQLNTAYNAHNLWLGLAVEQGLPGLVAFHLIWIALLWQLWKRDWQAVPAQLPGADAYRSMVLMAFLYVCMIMAEGLVNYPLRKYNIVLLFLIAGIGLAAAQRQPLAKLESKKQ